MAIHKLQQAIANAAAEVRARHPEIKQSDVEQAYVTYREHFEEGADDPPVSTRPAMDDLLLAIWDVIVDRETEELDTPEGELEEYYAKAFAGLLGDEPDLDFEHQPVALHAEVEESVAEPAPIIEEQENDDDARPHAIEVEPEESHGSVYKIRIALDGSQPEIWRELLVAASTPEARLHHYIQAAMGWPGSDDFLFTPPQDAPTGGSGQLTLEELLPVNGQDCGYEFEHWYHHMSLSEQQEPDPRRHYPVCTAGKGACPPVDSNVKEYNQRVSILRDPSHPDYEEVAGWVTQDFNPEAFNVEEANRRLGQYGDSSFQAVK